MHICSAHGWVDAYESRTDVEPVRIPVSLQRFVGGAARSDSPDNEHKSYQGHSEQEDTPESNTYCCSLRLSVHGGLGKRGPGACLHHDA